MKFLIQRPDGFYCFREKNDRVYYMSERILKFSDVLPSEEVFCAGTCFGKFTKNNKFKLYITALDYLAPYAQCKIWLKSSGEQQFLYGKHVSKAGLGRISENTGMNQGVIVYNMTDLPLGFGVAAKAAADCAGANPATTVCFHLANIGEYIRSEEDLL